MAITGPICLKVPEGYTVRDQIIQGDDVKGVLSKADGVIDTWDLNVWIDRSDYFIPAVEDFRCRLYRLNLTVRETTNSSDQFEPTIVGAVIESVKNTCQNIRREKEHPFMFSWGWLDKFCNIQIELLQQTPAYQQSISFSK